MADQERLPNLKICIDNDSSDDDSLSLTGDPDINLEENGGDKRIAVSTVKSLEETPDGVESDDDVQFNVYLNKYGGKKAKAGSDSVSNH